MATPTESVAQALTVRRDQQIADHARELTPDVLRERVQLMQRVMREVMKSGTHYGTIPGTDKPTLYKPGAELIATTFRLAVDPEVEDLSADDVVHYRVRVHLRHQISGEMIGTGIGECSSDEEKYRWRRAVVDQEFDATPIERRREKWGRGRNNSSYTIKQVRTNPADVANTVLKMAKKRAFTDAVLTCTAASDIFAQDLEDMPEELREAVVEAGAAAPAERTSTRRAPAAEASDDAPPADALAESVVAEEIEIAESIDALNEANAAITRVADPDARTRLRKLAGKKAKALAEGSGK